MTRHIPVDEKKDIVGAVLVFQHGGENHYLMHQLAILYIDSGWSQFVEPINACHILYKVLLYLGVHFQMLVEGILGHRLAHNGCRWKLQVDHRLSDNQEGD